MARRAFAILASFCLALTAMLVGSTSIVLANSNCDQTNPTADVVTSQIAAATSTGGVLYHVTLTNIGPCNVPDVTFADHTPAAIASVSVNPSSWNCTVVDTFDVDCTPTSTMGVPGTVDVYITTAFPTGDPTNVAVATVGGGATACTDGSAATTCDPSPDNNTSYGGLITAASTVRTIHTPAGGQSTQVTVGSGASLSAQIQQLTTNCPAQLSGCFGQMVQITGSNPAPQLKTFLYPLSMVPSYGQASIAYLSSTNNWVTPPGCNGKTPADPCLQSKSKVTIGGVSYLQFVIQTTVDDSWMAF